MRMKWLVYLVLSYFRKQFIPVAWMGFFWCSRPSVRHQGHQGWKCRVITPARLIYVQSWSASLRLRWCGHTSEQDGKNIVTVTRGRNVEWWRHGHYCPARFLAGRSGPQVLLPRSWERMGKESFLRSDEEVSIVSSEVPLGAWGGNLNSSQPHLNHHGRVYMHKRVKGKVWTQLSYPAFVVLMELIHTFFSQVHLPYVYFLTLYTCSSFFSSPVLYSASSQPWGIRLYWISSLIGEKCHIMNDATDYLIVNAILQCVGISGCCWGWGLWVVGIAQERVL